MITAAKYHMRQQWMKSDGFTLVEMLVAVSLIGLLSLGLASAMGLGIRTWNTSSSVNEKLDTSRAAQAALRQLLSATYPQWTYGNPAFVDFSGSSEEIEFISQAPLALNHPGYARFNLAVVESNGDQSLVLKLGPDIKAPGAASETNEVQLLANVESIEFSYFGPTETSPTPTWQPRWQNRNELPRLIRVEAVGRGKLADLWPTLIVKPAIDVDISCEFDALSRRCRGR